MFKSTGNNFGAPEITFKDYQSGHEIVLDAAFDYDADNEAYRRAEVLEIYVPALTLERSAVTHAFLGVADETAWTGTVVKAWIKDRRTLCIEKFNPRPGRTRHRLWLCSLFAGRGERNVRFDELATATPCSLAHDGPLGRLDQVKYLEREHYVLLLFTVGMPRSGYAGQTDRIYNDHAPFPDDIDVRLPLGCGLTAAADGPVMLEVEWKGADIHVPALPDGYGSGSSSDGIFYAFAVRDGAAADAANRQENISQMTE